MAATRRFWLRSRKRDECFLGRHCFFYLIHVYSVYVIKYQKAWLQNRIHEEIFMGEKTTCVIVGGGPAGMIAGLLLARAGVQVVVLEKHADFLRDFRGDAVHPSTLRLLDELGLYETFSELPHSKLRGFSVNLPGGRSVRLADFTRLPVKHPFVAMVPQWDLLDLLATAGRAEPAYELRMRHEVTGLLYESGRVAGVRYTSPDGPGELRADLTIACDGRWSACRREAGLVPHEYPMNLDVWWFRLPRAKGIGDTLLPRSKNGSLVGVIPRESYVQCGFFIPKGADTRLRAEGVGALRDKIAEAVPELEGVVGELRSFDDVKCLDIRLNRLRRWHTAGLLCIGDASHAMSPLGGVGINLAVQDAVAAARLLAEPLREHRLVEADLAAVQRRRALAVAVTQTMQRFMHKAVGRVMAGKKFCAAGVLLALVSRVPGIAVIPAYLIGMGFRPERSPQFARREG
jgi:2-polyprenyl-6-methoxyphenol hydroxylase-like FAD-dependent oxidoreductase